MSWPLSQDFNEAVQSPGVSFADEELKTAEVALSPLGLPIPRSGNFADVYQLTTRDGKKWAIKCFTRKVSNLQERYARIDEHLSQSRLPFGVKFHYLEQGIRIRGQWYPIVKMEWVEGFTLNEFVRDNLDKPMYLHALLQMWGKLCSRLRDANLAHADLQHGNVLLVPAATPNKLGLKLIDYDGMWVPTLAQQHSGELGHPNYQHPKRLKERIYSPDVDRFPHLVIATALRALLIGGKPLWDQFDNGDNLLFKESDFRDVASSSVFKALWSYRDKILNALVGKLALAAQQPLEKTPWLDEILFHEQGPTLTRAEEKQVNLLLSSVPTSKSKTHLVVQPKTVQAEYNVFADLDFEGNDLPPPLPRGRRDLPSPRRSGSGNLTPWFVAGGLGLVLLIGFIIGISMSGGGTTPVEPDPPDPELVEKDPKEEPKKDPVEPKKEETEQKIEPKIEAKKEPPPADEIELVPPPRLVEVKLENNLTELIQAVRSEQGALMRLQRSPDGNRFLAYHLRGGIAIYDARTGELLKGLQIPLMADERIESVTFGEDELLYLLRNSNGVQSVQEWNWKQNKSTSAEFEPSTVKSQFGGIQFLPKSNRLIAWGALNKIVIWNVGTGKIDVEFEPLTAQVTELLVTHDESAILIRVGFSRLLLWSLRQRMPITDYSIPPKTILRGIAISPDASHAAANATVDGIEQLLVWSTPTARLIESFPIAIRGYLQFAPDGNLLLGMLDERILGGVDLSRKKPIPLAYLPVRMKNFLVHPTENFLVSNDTDQSVRFWKLLPPEPLMTAMPKKEKLPENEGLLKTSEALRNDINHMQFTQDGKKLIAGTKDGFIYTLDAMTLKDLDGFQATQGTLLDMALTPKVTQGATMIPERVVTLGDDRKIRLWDLEDSKQLLELPSDRFYTKRPRLNLYVTPDGSTIIAHDLNKFRGYDARTGRELVVTPNSRGALQEISFSPLSKLAMTIGADKQVSILDPKTWKELRFVNVAMDLRGLQYCAESKSIVGYVRDGVYVIEDKPKGVVLHRFDHLNDVRDLVVVPGKPWVVSLSRTTRTSELRLWDIKSGNRLATYETRGRPSKIAISNDGLRIAVNDQNATVSIFGLPVKEEKK